VFNEALERLADYSSDTDAGVVICTPMMALVDYLGLRLTAVTALPLKHGSMIYGSNDGGSTVLDSDPIVSARMESILSHGLNLQRHLVGNADVGKWLYGPGDLECHLGTDGRVYALDFGRLLPPEAPNGLGERSIFFSFLRKERVLSSATPLNSDAFSNWSAKDPDFLEHNKHVAAATAQIYCDIQSFASELMTDSEPISPEYVDARTMASLWWLTLTQTQQLG